MGSSRRMKTGLYIVALSDGSNMRVVAKSAKAALKRGDDWCKKHDYAMTVQSVNEVF